MTCTLGRTSYTQSSHQRELLATIGTLYQLFKQRISCFYHPTSNYDYINHWQYYVDINANSLRSILYFMIQSFLFKYLLCFTFLLCCLLFFPFSFHTLDIFFIYHGSELCVHNFIKDKSVKAFMKIKLYGNLFLCGFND